MKFVEIKVYDNGTGAYLWRVFDAPNDPLPGQWTAYIRIDGLPPAAITEIESRTGTELTQYGFDPATGTVTRPGGGTYTIPSNRFYPPTTPY